MTNSIYAGHDSQQIKNVTQNIQQNKIKKKKIITPGTSIKLEFYFCN